MDSICAISSTVYQCCGFQAVSRRLDGLKAITLVYTVEEIAQMLAISLRSAYNLCNSTTEFRVLRVGGSIRVPKDSFDAWLRAA